MGRPRKMTDEELLNAIRDIAVDGKANSNANHQLKNFAKSRYGTWQEACYRAGVEPWKEGMSREREENISKMFEAFKDCFAYDGYRCRALTKMLCRYEGECRFYKRGETK